MDYSKLIDIGSKLTLAVTLMLILIGGWQGIWVYGPVYQQALKERDEWKGLALKGVQVAQDTSKRYGAMMGRERQMTSFSLPSNSSPEDVRSKLDELSQRTKFITEPTDKPLP